MILNLLLLSLKCRQPERTSLRDGLRLPSNSALKMIRGQLLYVMKAEGSFYMHIKSAKTAGPVTNSQLFLTDPRSVSMCIE